MRAVIFDFDGTLIDSAPEIRATMELAWKSVRGAASLFPHQRLRFGAPLLASIAALDPALDTAACEALAADFRGRYDQSDYAQTLPYPGIAELLDGLARRGVRSHLATNKRLAPTLRIADRYFSGRFGRVATLGAVSPDDGARPDSKRAMIEWILRVESLAVADGVMVGDTAPDIVAAREAGVRAIAVAWGYDTREELSASRPDALAETPEALLALLL